MNNDKELNSLQKVQADFISTVSHELRTPLTSIRGFADTILSSGDKLSEEQKRKFILIIKDQANRLIKLTENLLAVSKNEIEKLVLKSVDITPYIENCVKLVSAQSKKNTFHYKIQEKIPNILIDTDKFQQIMLNILENASKYSNPDTNIDINVFSNDTSVIIKVEDIGILIDDKDKERIFEKFTRISSPLTQKIEGSGLGLFLTKTLVERMRGKISACSAGNKTIFEVQFPISQYGDDVKVKMK